MKSLILILLTLLTLSSQADTLKVALRVTPPFVTNPSSDVYVGPMINLFEKCAYPLEYEYTPIEDMSNMDSLMEEYDIFVGAFGMTTDRETKYDLTHPFYSSTLSIATTETSGFWEWFLEEGIFNVLYYLLFMAIFITTISIAEEVNWFDAMYHTIVTLSTVGYGDITPKTWISKLATIAFIIFTLYNLGDMLMMFSQYDHKVDLSNKVVAVASGSTAHEYALRQGYNIKVVNSLNEFKGLGTDFDAVIHDHEILTELCKGYHITPISSEIQNYCWIMPDRSPNMEVFNREILKYARYEMDF